MLKFAILSIASIVSVQAFALPAAHLSQNSWRTQSAVQVLESKLGHSLSSDERQEVAKFVKEQSSANLVEVSDRSPKKKLKCLGFTVGAGGVMARAVCLHIHFFDGYGFEPTIQGYELIMLGGGFNFSLVGQVLGMDVIYDSSRYDKNFDPIPGKYGVVSIGGTLGVGFTSFGGDSGNKRIDGLTFNLGLALDMPTISMLVIQ